ncbi:MAG TPA: hypothetical protein VF140_00055, partial [Phycicoccus sp.]
TRLMSCGRCSRRFDVRHLFTWTFKGRQVTMPPAYAAALAELHRGPAAAHRRGHLRLGDVVEVVAPGPWRGRAGEVELVGSVRVQVRVDDVLVSLPLEGIRSRVRAEVARWDSRGEGSVSTLLP